MNALVLGGASCLQADLDAIGPWSGIVIATNDAGTIYPHRIDHWASLHPEKLGTWRLLRWANKGNGDYTTWTHWHKCELAERAIEGWTNGSSGLLAVGVAFELGIERVVLAGVPMDARPHYFDRTSWLSCMTHQPHWESRGELLIGRVFSPSGWTREFLGAPPADLIGARG